MPNNTELQGGTALETPSLDAGTGAVQVDVASGTPPDVRPPTLPTVSVESVIGLDEGETPRSILDHAAKRMRDQQPNNPLSNLERDPHTGRFIPAKAKAAPTKPAAQAAAKPGTPAPTTPTPPAPEAPKKIKVGDKEYTEAELRTLLEKKPDPASPAPQPAPTPQQQPAPAGPTPEQIKAAEDRFVGDMAKGFQLSLQEGDLEAVLVGGKEGVEAFSNILRNVAARAILETRKSVYPDFEQHFANLYSALEPLHAQQFELERYATEQAFVSQFPEYSGEDLQLARSVAEELLARYPQQVNSMTREQFVAEVDRQTSNLKQKEWSRYRREGDPESWKEYVRAQKAKAAPASGQPMAGPQTQPQAAPATPPAVPAPRPKPPAGNSPGVPGASRTARSQHASIAATLLD